MAASLELHDGSVATDHRHARLARGGQPPPLPLRGVLGRVRHGAVHVVGAAVDHHARHRRGRPSHRRGARRLGRTGRRTGRASSPASPTRSTPAPTRPSPSPTPAPRSSCSPRSTGRPARVRTWPSRSPTTTRSTEAGCRDPLDLQRRPPQAPQRPPGGGAVGRGAHPRRAARPPVAPRALVHDQVRQRRELLGGDATRTACSATSTPTTVHWIRPDRETVVIVDRRIDHRGRPRRGRRLRPRLVDHARAAGRRGARPHAVHHLGRLRRPRLCAAAPDWTDTRLLLDDGSEHERVLGVPVGVVRPVGHGRRHRGRACSCCTARTTPATRCPGTARRGPPPTARRAGRTSSTPRSSGTGP